jgi:putative oxidoreductase
MLAQLYKSAPGGAGRGIDIVRIGVALIILMHPLHGFAYPEGMPDFGAFLEARGYPFGTALAWCVISLQAACSVALLANRFVVPACIGHSVVIVFGIIHFHSQFGWYVVGPGTGGMEWGFILLSSLMGVMWAHWPRRV